MLSRRRLLATSPLLAGGAFLNTANAQTPRSAADPAFKVKNGRIRQSVMGWCFNGHFTPIELAKHCKEIGIVAIEGVSPEHFPEIRKLGLGISLVGSHGFEKGPCNPAFRGEVIAKLNAGIDLAVASGCDKVITFTGMRFEGMDDEKAAADCIEVWKSVLPHAEKSGVTLVLEHLNSRDGSHPMKGHPGYFGDDVDFCVELVKRVGSPHFKLLFDIYHVAIMNGDIIRRIREYKDVIGHYHTAGNPGRGELDNTQEINYPPILEAILETGYTGFVAQEFIPTWDDPLMSLRHAAEVCDV